MTLHARYDSGGAIGLDSLGSSWKLPPCLMEPVTGLHNGLAAAKASPSGMVAEPLG